MALHSIPVQESAISFDHIARAFSRALKSLQRLDKRMADQLYRWFDAAWTISGWKQHRVIVRENRRRVRAYASSRITSHRITRKTLYIHRWTELRLQIEYVSRCS